MVEFATFTSSHVTGIQGSFSGAGISHDIAHAAGDLGNNPNLADAMMSHASGYAASHAAELSAPASTPTVASPNQGNSIA